MRPSISVAVPMPDTLAKFTTTRHTSDFIHYLAALALVDFDMIWSLSSSAGSISLRSTHSVDQ